MGVIEDQERLKAKMDRAKGGRYLDGEPDYSKVDTHREGGGGQTGIPDGENSNA